MVSKENIDAVVGFLPALTRVSKRQVARYRESALEPEYHPQISALMKGLNRNNFVQSFDWPSWQAEAEILYKNPDLLARADLETCIKLLTLHMRKDRFSGGHFGAMIEGGHIVAILRRLQEL
jgi:Family of unknown function (DUF6508)